MKLGFIGHLYNEVSRNSKAIIFQCEAYYNKKCYGRVYLNLSMTEIVLKEKSIKHNHLPNFKSIHIAKIKEKIKRAARETDEITSLIILNAIPQLSKEALPRLLLS